MNEKEITEIMNNLQDKIFEILDGYDLIKKPSMEDIISNLGKKTHLFGCGLVKGEIPKDKIIRIKFQYRKDTLTFCDWECLSDFVYRERMIRPVHNDEELFGELCCRSTVGELDMDKIREDMRTGKFSPKEYEHELACGCPQYSELVIAWEAHKHWCEGCPSCYVG